MSVAIVPGGSEVRLDSHPARTPAGRSLILPSTRLADIVAGEWRAQATALSWARMPVTRLACSALDAGPATAGAMIRDFVAFAQADLLCYPVQTPRELARRQRAAWEPLIENVETLWNVRFAIGASLAPVAQDAALAEAAEAYARRLDPFARCGACAAARLFGSAILAVNLMVGAIDGAAAFAAAEIDEAFQRETWGVDSEAADRRETQLAEARVLGGFLGALAEP